MFATSPTQARSTSLFARSLHRADVLLQRKLLVLPAAAMCRFALYIGPPIKLEDLLTLPENSLIAQSRCGGNVSNLLGVEQSELWCEGLNAKLNERVNGDGFGVAWYDRRVASEPCLFKLAWPAWHDRNLFDLAKFVNSGLILAHVRAATSSASRVQGPTPVSEQNCHPFRYRRWTFMHNGMVPCFSRLRRRLRSLLPDKLYEGLEGTTDSEHLFALFLAQLPMPDAAADGGPPLDPYEAQYPAERIAEWLHVRLAIRPPAQFGAQFGAHISAQIL